ncbi:kinase-like domain-containing protein [Aspergillus oleicola]
MPGGYHPARIGDEFCSGRYRIVNKLGFGHSATTWLAEDRENKTRSVSIKISTEESVDRMFEQQILERLTKAAESDLKHPGRNIVQTLLDSFKISGPIYTHRCLVTEAERVKIMQKKEYPYHRTLPLPVVRATAAQLILGEQLQAKTGKSQSEPIIREDGQTIRISRPWLLAPPESRFANVGHLDEPLSFSADIWTLGCAIWEIFGDRPPFGAFPVEILSKLPERWLVEWKERRNWFDEDGRRIKRCFRCMLNLMLVLEPAQRGTIN